MSNYRLELWHQGPPYEAWGVSRVDRHNEGARSTSGFGNDLLAALEHLADVLLGPRCVECGDPAKASWFYDSRRPQMERACVCSTCYFWREKLREHGPNVAIVSGERFTIQPDQPRGYRGFLGHGGAEFRIRFHDGREVVTRNLWAQGRVPDHFRERLSNNAVFVRVGEYAGYRGSGTAHAHESATSLDAVDPQGGLETDRPRA
jgi:hypothetical protein